MLETMLDKAERQLRSIRDMGIRMLEENEAIEPLKMPGDPFVEEVTLKEWASLPAKRSKLPKKVGRAFQSRLPREIRTPEDAFRRLILKAFVELSCKAYIGEVLDRVGKICTKLTKNILSRCSRIPSPFVGATRPSGTEIPSYAKV